MRFFWLGLLNDVRTCLQIATVYPDASRGIPGEIHGVH